MPSVSIVIPVYNGIRTLHRPLEALRKQSLKDIEIIIVDDCSDDGSLAWADKFLRNGAVPYKVLSLDCHGGVSAARNLGMKEAAGDCVFFLDADDYIEKTCLEKLYSLFCDDENVDVAFCGFRRVNVLGEVLQQYFPRKKYLNHAVSGTEALNLFWKSKIDLHMTSCMVRRSFLFEKSVFFYDGCIYREDFEFFSRVLYEARKVASFPEELSSYVVDKSSTTGKSEFMNKAAIHELSVFIRLRKMVGESGNAGELVNLIEKLTLHGYIEVLERTLKKGKQEEFRLMMESERIRKSLAASFRRDIFLVKPEYFLKVLRLYLCFIIYR